MDIQSLLNNKRPLYESDSPPTKRQKIDEEVFSDETLEEDDNSLSPDNMKFTDPSVIAAGLENDQEVDLTGIEKLMLNEERLTRSAIHWNRLWDALKHNITLKKLYTGYCYGHESVNPIEDSHCLQLGEALKQNTALEELELDFHNFTSVGVVYIAEGLKFNKNLHSLVLGTNDLDFKALKALGEALKANNTLKKLDLSQLGDIKGDLVDFLVFCEALKTNTTLQHLSLHECVVAKEANDLLQEALKFNQGLEVIQPEVHAPPRPRKKKKKIDQDEASAADEAGVKASNTNSMADGAKSGAKDLQSPFSGRSARRAKLTARASIAPLMAKKTRKKRKNNDTVNNEVKITESEAKNSSNEVKNEDPTAKAQNDVNNDEVKAPITKKARNTKKAVNKLENTVKTFGLRRKQRKAKLFAQSMIKPLMIRKTRKRKKNVEAGDEEERSKSENIDNKSEASPSRLQRRAKLLAEANITPLVLKKTRKRRKTLEEENNNNKRTYTRKNNGVKEEKLLKPRKYVRKQEVKSEDKGANNTNVLNNNNNNNIEIKVPENQRKAKYFARANITPLMIRKTRKRRKDAKKEKEEDQNGENDTNKKERKAKLLARKSITPLVFKKTRKRRNNSEENAEPNSPIKEKPEVKVPRAIGRPPKKREFKAESTSSSIPDTKSKPVVAFKPRRQRHKFIITYQAKSKELPRRRAKKEY